MKVKNIWIRARGFNILLNAEMHDFIITLFNINPVNKTLTSLDSPSSKLHIQIRYVPNEHHSPRLLDRLNILCYFGEYSLITGP
jgi:hypothetical protein